MKGGKRVNEKNWKAFEEGFLCGLFGHLWRARAWKNIYEYTEEKRRRRRGEAKEERKEDIRELLARIYEQEEGGRR